RLILVVRAGSGRRSSRSPDNHNAGMGTGFIQRWMPPLDGRFMYVADESCVRGPHPRGMHTLAKTRAVAGWALLAAAAILLQTLFFKFTGAEESVYIFTTRGVEPWGRI